VHYSCSRSFKSSKLVPTESPYNISYYSSIVTIYLSSIIWETERFIGKKSAIFCQFYPPQSLLKLSQRLFHCYLGYERCQQQSRIPGLPGSENHVIICLHMVLAYDRRIDRQADSNCHALP